MKHSVTVNVGIPSSFAVDQVRGMFDLVKQDTMSETFDVELPGNDKDWQIGVIVGPSGSGKSTVARHAYGKQFVEKFNWKKTGAVVDNFGKASIKDVTQMLTAVGFSSPPAWVKPHHVLSGGERFRCDLARALMMRGELVAFDEFTSVVDRTVAKIGSAAIAKGIRNGRIKKKFVAVTCHYDILEWLEPDWVLDMASCQLARGSLHQRPDINLTVAPVHHSCWELFRRHHYLNTSIVAHSKCFVAFWNNEPVAFSSWVRRMASNKKNCQDMREHRTVVLPDFQGVGIGNRLSAYCAGIWKGVGLRAYSTTSHPSMIHSRNSSRDWRTIRFGMVQPRGATGRIKIGKESVGRVTGGFEYIGPSTPNAKELVEQLAFARPTGADVEKVLLCIALGAKTKRAIANATGVDHKSVDRIVSQLVRSGHVSTFKHSNKSLFECDWRFRSPYGSALPHRKTFSFLPFCLGRFGSALPHRISYI